MCEKCYRKSCKDMRNKSARQRGKKKKLQLHNINKVSSTTVWRYRQARLGKPWREKGGEHADMVSEGFGNFKAKGDRLANSRDVNPLGTIWIIVKQKTCKEQAPKSLDELRQWLRFAWRSVSVDTLWELVHSIPHHLENVRKHKERHSGQRYFGYSVLNE